SALNVGFRDLQHIIANIVQLAFFATPVLYIPHNLPERYRLLLTYGNPMAVIVTAYQSIFYSHQLPAMEPLAGVAIASGVLLWISTTVFERRREEFAETV
ncbi:MAG: ABC transporter permease, partial [Myxococcaceae bacterium]